MAREMKDKLHNIDKAIKALEKYMENTKTSKTNRIGIR